MSGIDFNFQHSKGTSLPDIRKQMLGDILIWNHETVDSQLGWAEGTEIFKPCPNLGKYHKHQYICSALFFLCCYNDLKTDFVFGGRNEHTHYGMCLGTQLTL